MGALLAIGYGSSQRLLNLNLEAKKITTSSFEKKIVKKEKFRNKKPLTLENKPILEKNFKSQENLLREEETFKSLANKQNRNKKVSQEPMKILSNTNHSNNKKAQQSMESRSKQKIKHQSLKITSQIDKTPISIDSLPLEAELFFREQNIDELIKTLPKT